MEADLNFRERFDALADRVALLERDNEAALQATAALAERVAILASNLSDLIAAMRAERH